MFVLFRAGVAFNTQGTGDSQYNPGQFYADPAQVLTRCLEITPRVVLRITTYRMTSRSICTRTSN